jgi:ABC-type transporter Mla MlaB component
MAQSKTSKKKATSKKPGGGHTVNLGELLEVGKIAGLYQSLEAALDVDQSVIELNAGKVERADAASLQLLLAFHREAKALGYEVRWNAPSDILRNAARHVGLVSVLGLA